VKCVVLDTNAYSALLGGDRDVWGLTRQADRVLLPVFVLGELLAGFRGGSRLQKNLAALREFLAQPEVEIADATAETADIFARLKVELKQAGTPLPINDVWIAAQTMEFSAVLVSYDRHFLQIPGLRLWPKLRG